MSGSMFVHMHTGTDKDNKDREEEEDGYLLCILVSNTEGKHNLCTFKTPQGTFKMVVMTPLTSKGFAESSPA